MADSLGGHPHEIEQESLDTNQQGQATNVIVEESSTYSTKQPDVDTGSNMDAQDEAIKDKIDDAVPKGVKRADPSTGGRVMVGETGDLRELAARRQQQ